MLLDEDPARLIHFTLGNFNITPDKLAVGRINDGLGMLHDSRSLELEAAEEKLRKTTRTLTTLQNHHAELLSTHSSTAHASEILRLDTAKFRIAKSASDLEIETERLSSQLADLQAKLQELEIQGVDGGDSAKRLQIQDEILLKLACYKSFGFEVERKANGEGDFDRVIVRGSGGVQIVSLDGKFSKFFYANHFWKTL